MTRKRTTTIIALGVVVLTGCELVAGITDLTLSDDAGGASDAAQNNAESSVDTGPDVASASDAAEATPGDGAPTSDVGDAPFGADVKETGAAETGANGDATLDGPPDGAGAGPDAEAGHETGAVADAAGEAGDGGLVGPDGGPIVTELIDNMEIQGGAIALSNGRDGFWHVYDDGTTGGVLTPAPGGNPFGIIGAISPPRGTSMFAAHIQGSGFAMFAGMGFDMVDMSGTKRLYDASPYQGFVFWGRSSNPSPLAVRMLVPDVNTDTAGGICTTCGDNFGANFTLTTSWQQYVVYYTDLRQLGFGHPNASDDGGPRALAASQTYGCQFQVSTPASTPAFDVWIDDIYFIRK